MLLGLLAGKKQLTKTERKRPGARLLEQIKPNCSLLSRTEKSLSLQSCNDEVPRIENRPNYVYRPLRVFAAMDAGLPAAGFLANVRKEENSVHCQFCQTGSMKARPYLL